MIGFKEFLLEARMAPLYHGTPFESGIAILEDGAIKTMGQGQPSKILNPQAKYVWEEGISFSRSFNFSKGWVSKNGSYLVFEVNQQKLTHNFKISPINFWSIDKKGKTRFQGNHHWNEYEEFVRTTRSIPLKNVDTIHYYIQPDKRYYEKSLDDTMKRISEEIKRLYNASKKYPNIKFVPIGDSKRL